MKKRIVSFLMALVLAVSLLPVSALAVDVDTPQDDAPVAETQGVPAVEQQNDENTTPDPQTEPTNTSDTVTFKVESPKGADAYIDFTLQNSTSRQNIDSATGISSYTTSVSKDTPISVTAQIKGYDNVHYRFVGWQINGRSGVSETVDGYVINPGNNSSYAKMYYRSEIEEHKLLDEYVFTALFEENESGQPAAGQVKLVIDLTEYTGAISGSLTPLKTNPWKIEAGKRNEIMIGRTFGLIEEYNQDCLYGTSPKGTLTLDDAPKSFYWTVTGLPDKCILTDFDTGTVTAQYQRNATKFAKVFTLTAGTLTFNQVYASNFTSKYNKDAWSGKTIVLTPDFNALDQSKAFTPVVTPDRADKGTVTTAFLRNNGSASSSWAVTATPKNEWYKLDYVADEAGNKFVSEDGKTAQITVTAADQKFTAYFTSAIAPMYDETNADSVTVNVTISNDGIPLMGADGTVLANLDVTIPYFDLADYGLSKYYRYGTEFGWGSYNNDKLIERPTALHAYIYIIERYYMGLPADQCGRGTSGILDYKKKTDVPYMDGGIAYNSGRTVALNPTGSATSLYMKQFWGHDENLMYFRNHEYPLMGKGWGSTCDYILLSDGDRLDVAMFTNWDFYKDGGFNQFSQDVYSIAQGDTVTTSTFKAGTSAGLDGESPALEPISGLNVAVYDADWNKVADVTGDGTYSYTFDKAGTYYIMATDTGAKTTDAHYAPAITKVTVTPRDDSGAVILKNTADMLWFQNYVNEQGHYDAKAVLANDIDISSLDWQGLGENVNHYDIPIFGYKGDKAFSGEIDGRGHTLTVRFTGSPLVNLLTGTVKNLTIKGKSEAGAAFVRYLLYNGRIENCVNYASVSGIVKCSQNTGEGTVGAFAATACVGPKLLYRTTGIVNCVNRGDVQTTGHNAGGILGQVAGSFQGNFTTGTLGSSDYKVYASIEVTGCRNYGAVSAVNSNAAAGGIVGICWMADVAGVALADCENHGAVSAPTGGAAAGILAQQNSEQQTISRCLNTGTITGTSYAAGITGTSSGEPTLIESCANTGKIAGQYAGGIVAVSFGEITDCYNTGDVTGSEFAGGIAGSHNPWQFPNTHNYAVGKVSNCYTTGKVTGSSDNATIGAAVGKLHTGNIVSLEQTTYRDFQVYALEGTCAQLVGQKSENAKDATAFKTAAELKSDAMLTTLGDAFKKDAGNVNNGYPVLVWQVSEPCTKHTPGEIVKVSIQNANCTTGGRHYDVVYCTVCLKELSRTIVTDEPLGHDWDSATGKCKRCGITCDHKWTNGKCDTCGYACQHVGGDAVKEKEVPATCTKDGSHDEVVYCTICKAEVSRTNVVDKATGHKEQPAVKENVKAPTCTVDGSHDEVVYCSVCKEEVSRTNVVDKATGHKWDDGVVTTQPTTGKEGVKTFICTVCKETKTETIDKLGEDQKDQSAANEAINLINGIGTVTKNSKDKINAARKAYDGLTEDQKKLVPDSVLKTLTDAETAYANLPRSSGSGSSYTGGHTFTTDLEPGSITGVFVDGKKLDSRYYTVSGSDVTLTADYLKTLRSGKHTVKIENATKVATGSFTLSGSGAVQSSRTGDPGVAIYFAMSAVSFLGSAAWLRKRKET